MINIYKYINKKHIFQIMSLVKYNTQNELLLHTLLDFYKKDDNLNRILKIITGETKISLRKEIQIR